MANPCKFQLPGEDRWMTEDEFKQRLSEGLLDKLMVDNNLSFRGIKPDRALAESYTKSTELPKTTAEKAQSMADAVRGMKLKPGSLTGGDTGVALSSVPGFEEAWNAAVEVVAKAIEIGGESIENIQKAFDKGFQEIKNSDWYKGLDKQQKKQAYKDYYKGMDERFPKQPVSRATRAAGKEFAGKVEEATGLAPEEKSIRMTPGEALKKRIKDLMEGGKLGVKAIQDIKKEVRDYAEENLPSEKYSKSEVNRIMNAITNSTESNLDKVIDRIDKLVEKKEGQKESREAKAAEAKRVQTAKEIARMVKNKRTILTKVNNKWKGKITVEAQKEFKEFVESGALDNLDAKTQQELDAIKEVLDAIVDTGKADFKRFKEIQEAQKRKESADLLEGLVAGNNIGRKDGKKIEPKILNGQEEIDQFLSDGGSVIIDGQLYTKSTFDKWKSANSNIAALRENLSDIQSEKNQLTEEAAQRVKEVLSAGGDIATDTEYIDLKNAIDTRNEMITDLKNQIKEAKAEGETVEGLDGVKGYEARNMTLLKDANLPSNLPWYKKLTRMINPINAINDIYSLLEKASSGNSVVRKWIKDNLAAPIQEAYVNRLEETTRKINDYNDGIADIFGSKKKALKKLSDIPEWLNVISDRATENINTTNSHLVSYYNLSRIEAIEGQRDSGESRLKKSGVDVNKVRSYVESDPELKQYADFLMEKYNDLKTDYEPVYELYANMPLPEGTYYPEYASNFNEDFINLDDVMNSEGGIDGLSAVSNNMKQRTTFKGQYNLRMDAHATMLDYIKNMEHAKQFMPIAKKVNQLFNKQNSPYLIEALDTKGFNEMREAMAVILSDQSPKYRGEMTNVMNAISSLSVLGTLGFKPASIIKQFTSFTHFWTAGIKDGISPTSIMTAIPKSKDEWEFFNKLRTSEYMKDRWKGGSIDIEMKRIIDQSSKSKTKKSWEELMKAAMLPIRVGDRAAILYGPGGGTSFALAVYRRKLAEGMSQEEAYDYAYKRFITESERTQQSTREDIASNIQRDPIFRMMGMYRTGQMSMSKKVINGARTLINASKMEKNEGIEARKKAITDEEITQATTDIIYYTTVGSLAFAAVSSGVIKLLWDGGGYDDDDKKRMYYDLVMDQINADLQGYGAMGFIADWALNTARGDDWKNTIPALKGLNNILALKPLLDVPGRTWQSTTEDQAKQFLEEGTNPGKGQRELLVSGEEYDKLMEQWNNQMLWSRMTDAEKQVAAKAIGLGNLRTTYNNFEQAVNGEKGVLDAIMNWEEDYFKIAREKKKRDRIFEFIFSEPYLKPEKGDDEIPSSYLPKEDLFGGELIKDLNMDTGTGRTPQEKKSFKKY